MQQQEIWEDVPGYENVYQVSTLGRVKSLERRVPYMNSLKTVKERILKERPNSNRYLSVQLSVNGIVKGFNISTLVAITFLNHKPNGHKLVVDHIDNNPLNNRLDNLQIITNRENCSKDKNGLTGSYWNKDRSCWFSSIRVNKKVLYLGRFNTAIEASNAYQSKLREII